MIRSIRVGSLVYASDQGLGYLAKAFWDHQILTDVVVVMHTRRDNHSYWYADTPPCLVRGHYRSAVTTPPQSVAILAAARNLIAKVDVLLLFETPFVWEIVPWAQEQGKKVVLMPMHECMPEPLPYWPDLMLCPSLLDLEWADKCTVAPPIHPSKHPAVFLPVPPDQVTPWRRRGEVTTFVHNAGHGGLLGRNGTAEVFAAWELVKSQAKLVVRSQAPLRPLSALGVNRQMASFCNPDIDVRVGTFDRATLYEEGEVFLFPERFNGLSLPLQEAYAAGMVVMAGDRFPMNTWLPHEPLIPVIEYRPSHISRRCWTFQDAIIRPEDIAAKVDAWYGRDAGPYSDRGKEWAAANSWEVLGPQYLRLLEEVYRGS